MGLTVPLGMIFGFHLGDWLPGVWMGYGASSLILAFIYSCVLFLRTDWSKLGRQRFKSRSCISEKSCARNRSLEESQALLGET
jgi:hypothetical protein